MVFVPEFHVTGDLYHGTWMSSASVIVSVCTQNESTPPKNSTRHNAHAHRTAIFVRLQPRTSRRRDRAGIGQANVQRAGEVLIKLVYRGLPLEHKINWGPRRTAPSKLATRWQRRYLCQHSRPSSLRCVFRLVISATKINFRNGREL
jgi:hypothetical protein